MEFYEPQEDSLLFQKFLESIDDMYLKESKLRILDVGTGSGILAQCAATVFSNSTVTGIDINEHALSYASKHNSHGRVTYGHCDVFTLQEQFDMILCNPPYLPAHHLDTDDLLNKALVGGKKGWEYIRKLLNHLPHILKKKGVMYLLFSNATNKDMVEKYIRESLCYYTCVASQFVGLGETLYIYEIKFLPILSEICSDYSSYCYFTKGKRGVIIRAESALHGQVIIKSPLPDTDVVGLVRTESTWLSRANKLGLGPQFIHEFQNGVVMEYIKGIPIGSYLKNNMSVTPELMVDILEQCFVLDTNGIQKSELVNPYKHIIITPQGKAAFIDFERCSYVTHPQNVTQCCEYYKKFGVEFDVEIVKQYKKNQTRENFELIKRFLKK